MISRVSRLRTTRSDEEVFRALAGDEGAKTRLVARLTPVIQARVGRRLMTCTPEIRTRQTLEDLVQETFLCLFDNDSKILRGWDPRRASIEHFVGIVTQLRLSSFLRSSRRNSKMEEATEAEVLERHRADAGPERQIVARESLRLLLECFDSGFNDRDWSLFAALFLYQRSAAEVGRELRMTDEAVYKWRSRFRKKARLLFDELDRGYDSAKEGNG